MQTRTKRLLFGAFLIGMAAKLAMGFLLHDQYGAHLLPSLLVGFFVGAGAFYLGYANSADQR